MNDQPTQDPDHTRALPPQGTPTRDDDPSTRLSQFHTDATQGTSGELIGGRYRLRNLLGEGGFGSVWRAEQIEPVKRLVAVKLIKAGMDSKAVLARFDAERQALAVMDHPNIARVLDGGATDDGHPYFVMEYVPGQSITRFCDERKLTVRQRLELFIPVCHAVQHAHQKGIIHRDIKPGNVLVAEVDGKPAAKVIDFGVAKATGAALTDLTLNTGLGAIVGTPEYMSPEQADPSATDIDTRSDVYSLGALLYELLAGSPPFSRKTLANKGLFELLRLVREVDPPRPSEKLGTSDNVAAVADARSTDEATLSKLLRREVDWVVMKALEKDRNRRYDTPAGLAADVERYLAGEAVSAVPPTLGYRVRKWVKKNRAAVLVAAVVAVALLGAGIGGGVGLVESGKRKEADELRAQAEQAKKEAEKARDEADDAKRRVSRFRIETECVKELSAFQERFDGYMNRPDDPDPWAANDLISNAAEAFRQMRDPNSDPFLKPNSLTEKRRRWDWETNYLTRFIGTNWNGPAQTALPRPWLAPDLRTTVAGDTVCGCVSGLRPRFSADSKRLAYWTTDGRLAVWDVIAGREVGVVRPGKSKPLAIAVSPDGTKLATSHVDGVVRVWDVTGDRPIASLDTRSVIVSADYLNDGQLCLFESGDQGLVRAYRWNPTAVPAQPWSELELGAEIRALRLAVINDTGDMVMMVGAGEIDPERGDREQVVYCSWKGEKLTPKHTRFGGRAEDGWACVDANPASGQFVAREQPGNSALKPPLPTIGIRNTGHGRVEYEVGGFRLKATQLPKQKGSMSGFNDIALFSSGDRAVTANSDGTLSLWRYFSLIKLDKTSFTTTVIAHPFITLPAPGVRMVVISPDQGTVCTIHDDGTVKLWNGR